VERRDGKSRGRSASSNEDGGCRSLHPAPFSADSRTAYFGTAVLGGSGQLSFLYAVETGAGGTPPPSPPPTQCVVPGVVGMTLDAASTEIVEAGCAVGRVRRVASTQVGIVLAQNPAAGTALPAGGRVALTVGRT
jgi:hypothetical protein